MCLDFTALFSTCGLSTTEQVRRTRRQEPVACIGWVFFRRTVKLLYLKNTGCMVDSHPKSWDVWQMIFSWCIYHYLVNPKKISRWPRNWLSLSEINTLCNLNCFQTFQRKLGCNFHCHSLLARNQDYRLTEIVNHNKQVMIHGPGWWQPM